MAVTANWYMRSHLKAWAKEIDYLNDTIKVALLGTGYTPDLDNHDFWDDVSANEITGSGYVAGGTALTAKSLTYDSAANKVKFNANTSSWGTATFSTRYAVVYNDTPALASGKHLIGLVDFGATESPAGENFSLAWAGGTVLDITLA